MNLSKLDKESEVTPPPPQHTTYKTGSALLAENSQNGYEILRNEMARDFSFEKSIPSFYMMIMNRPCVIGFMLEPLKFDHDIESELYYHNTATE